MRPRYLLCIAAIPVPQTLAAGFSGDAPDEAAPTRLPEKL